MSGGGGAFVEHFFSAPDGLRLYARIYGGHDDALPVVCLPGLSRNARDFHELALFLSRDADRPRTVIVFDYRGRGRSDYDRNWRNYDVPTEAGDVLAGLTALGIAHAAFIAASRGGLIVFALAAMRPAAVRAVVLNDIGPVLEGDGLAQIRAWLERAPRPTSFEEALAVHKAAHAAVFPALDETDWKRMVRAIYRDEGGRPVADFDPALVKTVRDIDFNQPLPVFWPQFTGLAHVPVFAIRGGNSNLLSAETLALMAERHPAIETVTIEGQGHPPLLETAGLPARIAAFLDREEKRKASRRSEERSA